jgi:hypothetical protein
VPGGHCRRDDLRGPSDRGRFVDLDANSFTGGSPEDQDPDSVIEISNGKFCIMQLAHFNCPFSDSASNSKTLRASSRPSFSCKA